MLFAPQMGKGFQVLSVNWLLLFVSHGVSSLQSLLSGHTGTVIPLWSPFAGCTVTL